MQKSIEHKSFDYAKEIDCDNKTTSDINNLVRKAYYDGGTEQRNLMVEELKNLRKAIDEHKDPWILYAIIDRTIDIGKDTGYVYDLEGMSVWNKIKSVVEL